MLNNRKVKVNHMRVVDLFFPQNHARVVTAHTYTKLKSTNVKNQNYL